MELTPNQLSHVISRMPEFELSYETISHSKVSLDYQIVVAVPLGKKYYAWFSFHQNKDVCYLFELNREKRIIKGKCITMPTETKPTLALGTLLYGSIPDGQPDAPFIIEDIFFFQGISLKKEKFGNRMEFLLQFMEANPQISPKFVLPVMWNIAHPLTEDAPVLPHDIGYQVHHLQYRTTDVIKPFLNVQLGGGGGLFKKKNNPSKPTQCADKQSPLFLIESQAQLPLYKPDFNKPQYKMKAVFQVRADIQFDIYHLFAFGKNKEPVYYNVAYIQNYKTSVFMNGLFRKIRENKNLDFIEESDDEDDFQNTNIDKYVNLQKKLYMECVFHAKFKKWIPIKIVDKNERVVHISKLVRGYDNY
uniref:Uncharacterized protein n=1 Tax=viral metagenome TaxID=1070528 RepID=A0A6C0H2I5_9ZZZZ